MKYCWCQFYSIYYFLSVLYEFVILLNKMTIVVVFCNLRQWVNVNFKFIKEKKRKSSALTKNWCVIEIKKWSLSALTCIHLRWHQNLWNFKLKYIFEIKTKRRNEKDNLKKIKMNFLPTVFYDVINYES